MDKDGAIKLIGQRLAGRDYMDMAEFIDAEMDLVQSSILDGKAFVPWFMQGYASIVLAADKRPTIALPDDFARPDVESGVWAIGEGGEKKELRQMDLSSMRKQYEGVGEGFPNAFALWGVGAAHVAPSTGKEYLIDLFYMKKDVLPSQLQGNEDNLWLRYGANVFINEVGKVCALVVRDGDAYGLFDKGAKQAWVDLEAQTTERRFNSQELYFFGED